MFVTIKDIHGKSSVWHMSCVKLITTINGYFASVRNLNGTDYNNIHISNEEYDRINIMKEQEDKLLHY